MAAGAAKALVLLDRKQLGRLLRVRGLLSSCKKWGEDTAAHQDPQTTPVRTAESVALLRPSPEPRTPLGYILPPGAGLLAAAALRRATGSLLMASKQELDDFLASVERRAFKQAAFAVRDDDSALDIVQDAM